MRKSDAPSSSAKRSRVEQKVTRRVKTPLFRSVGPSSKSFPKQLSIQQKCCGRGTLTLNGATPAQTSIAVNDIYACLSHQAYYFDQLSGIYQNFVVMNSKITVQFYPQTQCNFYAGIHIEEDGAPTPASLGNSMEVPGAVYGTYVATNEALTLTKKWSAKEAFGGNIRDNDDLGGTASASPATKQYFTPWVCGNSTEAQTAVVTTMITLTFDVVWDNLKTILGS